MPKTIEQTTGGAEISLRSLLPTMPPTRSSPNGREPRRQRRAPEIYYDKKTHNYWMQDASGNWTSIIAEATENLLREAGFSGKPLEDETISDLQREMNRIRFAQGVDYAGPLSGHRNGAIMIDDKRILVTRTYKLIEPQQGPAPTINAIVNGLLGTDQAVYFRAWLKLAYEALREGKRRPGHALVLAGPADCGKSFVQTHIITPILGGRAAKCYRSLSGNTEFNGDLFEVEHLIIDDEAPKVSMSQRMALGANIKSVVAGEVQSCHYKNQDAFSAAPFWRLSLCVNDDPEYLLTLPPLDASLEDKVILLKAGSFPMPMPTETMEERAALRDTIQNELPGFIYELGTMDIAPEMTHRRFGIKHHHHPDLLAGLHELSAEAKFLDLIDTEIFPSDDDYRDAVHLTAAELEQRLCAPESSSRDAARKLLGWNSACGTLLGRLAKKFPHRVVKARTAKSRIWELLPPEPNPDQKLPSRKARTAKIKTKIGGDIDTNRDFIQVGPPPTVTVPDDANAVTNANATANGTQDESEIDG